VTADLFAAVLGLVVLSIAGSTVLVRRLGGSVAAAEPAT
jgi:hypothetical protein